MRTPSPATETEEPSQHTPDPGRRPYRSPRLVEYGDVRDLTFGMTPGMGDSGNPAIFKPQGF